MSVRDETIEAGREESIVFRIVEIHIAFALIRLSAIRKRIVQYAVTTAVNDVDESNDVANLHVYVFGNPAAVGASQRKAAAPSAG